MSAPAYARPAGAPRAPGAEPDRQPRLFALPGGAEALSLPETAPQRPALAPVPAFTSGQQAGALRGSAPRTLGSELRLAWTALAARSPAACIMCGGRMEPHAHAPGGACTSCGTSLD